MVVHRLGYLVAHQQGGTDGEIADHTLAVRVVSFEQDEHPRRTRLVGLGRSAVSHVV